MSILIQPDTKILVQGITGDFGARHAKLSLDYGTRLVGGVTPGKGGQFFEHKEHKVPIFNSVARRGRCDRRHGVRGVRAASVRRRRDPRGRRCRARSRSRDHRGHPGARHDPRKARDRRPEDASDRPELPGVVTPGSGPQSHGGCRIGIAPGYIHKKGHVGVVSRSGTLTYEAVYQLERRRTSASPPAWASAAIRSTARRTSM
jgi:succinyl-CoA synthetase alpha subunit